jgi:hypothetical protein
MADRTVCDFYVPFDVAPYADAWAQANRFRLKSIDPDGARRYQRGDGIVTGVMLAVVRQAGPAVRIETWIHATLVARIGALFLIRENMSVESGGVRGVLPRKTCREAVNKLLLQLGQQPIP